MAGSFGENDLILDDFGVNLFHVFQIYDVDFCGAQLLGKLDQADLLEFIHGRQVNVVLDEFRFRDLLVGVHDDRLFVEGDWLGLFDHADE